MQLSQDASENLQHETEQECKTALTLDRPHRGTLSPFSDLFLKKLTAKLYWLFDTTVRGIFTYQRLFLDLLVSQYEEASIITLLSLDCDVNSTNVKDIAKGVHQWNIPEINQN